VRVIDHLEIRRHTGGCQQRFPTKARTPFLERDAERFHIVTDVIGATALLRGPAGHVLSKCETPCSFNNLSPSQYSLEVQKEGYQPVANRAAGKERRRQDQKIKLESLPKAFTSAANRRERCLHQRSQKAGQTTVDASARGRQYTTLFCGCKRISSLTPDPSKSGQYPDEPQCDAHEKSRAASPGAGELHSERRRRSSLTVRLADSSTPARCRCLPDATIKLRFEGFQEAKRSSR